MSAAAARAIASRACVPASKTALLIHGAGGGGWEYDMWKSVFHDAHGWSTIAHDLEPSPSGLAATTLSDYVAQVVRWPESSKPAGRSTTDAGLVLVGASMGGAIALHAASALSPLPSAVVLINPVVPRPWAQPTRHGSRPLPDVLRWAGSSLESTASSLYDSTPEVQRWACERWRDESGAVMRELYSGYAARRPSCPTLFVVSLDDQDVPPDQQLEWAAAWEASTLTYPGMSHVGPLLGTAASDVARAVAEWVETTI